MKATIEFNRNDPDDNKALLRALHADETYLALWVIKHRVIPDFWKREDIGEQTRAVLEELVDEIHETLEEYGVDLEIAPE